MYQSCNTYKERKYELKKKKPNNWPKYLGFIDYLASFLYLPSLPAFPHASPDFSFFCYLLLLLTHCKGILVYLKLVFQKAKLQFEKITLKMFLGNPIVYYETDCIMHWVAIDWILLLLVNETPLSLGEQASWGAAERSVFRSSRRRMGCGRRLYFHSVPFLVPRVAMSHFPQASPEGWEFSRTRERASVQSLFDVVAGCGSAFRPN